MSSIESLSKAEMRVTREVARGYSEKEIADHLCVSYKTVRTHTYNIRKKLKARCAVDIARQYIQSLEDPKKFCITVYANPDIDLRKPVRTSTRIVRTARKTE